MKNYKDNLTLLTDFYELTMMNGYMHHGLDEQIGYFDYFFRTIPDGGGFALTCGLAQVIDYIKALKFTKEDIEFLRSKDMFDEKFLKRLESFRFSGDMWAMPEGTPVFPNEPIMVVKGTMFEAQLIETVVLLLMNHQSLICTKASRIVRAAKGKAVLEFGARRAQGVDAAVLGARAAYIAGCVGSSNTMADRHFGVPSSGTMAHSWVQLFDSEYESFKAYTETYPDESVLLVDTYDVIKSGVPNAIRVFDEVLVPLNKRPRGIRIDSGDIAYLSKHARVLLDEAGYEDCKIFASNSLDEYLIRDMHFQGAKLDAYGVGERLITSKSSPVFGGVYKLVGVEKKGEIIPKIKLSENVEKITTPAFKKVWRLFDNQTDSPIADVVTLVDEHIDDTKPYELFHPEFTWKRKVLKDFYAKELLVQIFNAGECVYEPPTIEEVRNYCLTQVDNLWDEVKRFENPHRYYVDLSPNLWTLKREMIQQVKTQLHALSESDN
ncbi:nicotinate phosphoribosyltransferase [Fusibacter sp. A2]|nr:MULTISPECIES: nicotinate phosphoribosyltransferase [unclassified Fusibacter]MCK8060591.1 nicotinate phosphoribosyltransferase [Fusibacter sp. A2]